MLLKSNIQQPEAIFFFFFNLQTNAEEKLFLLHLKGELYYPLAPELLLKDLNTGNQSTNAKNQYASAIKFIICLFVRVFLLWE